MEFTSPGAGDMSVFKRLPENVEIGLGCVDVTPGRVDSAETIVSRVRKALQFLAPERITLCRSTPLTPRGDDPTRLAPDDLLPMLTRGRGSVHGQVPPYVALADME